MAYTVTGAAGRQRVSFTCGRCGAALASPLAEAGQRFPCPTCGTEFTTPGTDELRQQQAAATEADAQRRATIEAAQQATPPRRAASASAATLDYSTGRGSGPAATAADVPEYPDLLSGHRLLRAFARVAEAFGWVAIIAGGVAAGIGIINRENGVEFGLTAQAGLAFFAATVAYALPCFVVALLLRTLGAAAIALRDIARNSFRR